MKLCKELSYIFPGGWGKDDVLIGGTLRHNVGVVARVAQASCVYVIHILIVDQSRIEANFRDHN